MEKNLYIILIDKFLYYNTEEHANVHHFWVTNNDGRV